MASSRRSCLSGWLCPLSRSSQLLFALVQFRIGDTNVKARELARLSPPFFHPGFTGPICRGITKGASGRHSFHKLSSTHLFQGFTLLEKLTLHWAAFARPVFHFIKEYPITSFLSSGFQDPILTINSSQIFLTAFPASEFVLYSNRV